MIHLLKHKAEFRRSNIYQTSIIKTLFKRELTMQKATYKVEGGKMIRVSLKERDDKIQKIKITGDFFLHPEELIEELEKALVGKSFDAQDLNETIKSLTKSRNTTLLGASPEDFVKCILMAGGRDD